MKLKAAILATLTLLGVSQLEAKDILVQVNGMKCAFCAQGIPKHFKKESAVKDIQVDLDKMTVKLLLNDGKNIEDQKIEELIKDSGLSVKSIERL